MVKVPVYNVEGEEVDHIELSELVFGVPANQAVVHQAMVRQLANARQGTASVKTRGQVSGGGRKLFRQKGTGYARRGSRRAPLLRGGGVIFGPHPRNYRQAMPKRMRRLALRSLLSAKVAGGEMTVLNEFGLSQPKTKDMSRILKNLGIDASVLIVTAESDANVYRSARNIEKTKTLPAAMLNVVDLLTFRRLLITTPAVRVVEETWVPKERRRTLSAA